MALTFNLLLRDAGLDLSRVRLLRHETREQGRTPYALWRDDRSRFEDYQRFQLRHRRPWFAADHWASFVVGPDGQTLFAGLYGVGPPQRPGPGVIDPLSGGMVDQDQCDLYIATLGDPLRDLIGRLVIAWGAGTRTWVQLAANQDKIIVELRERFTDPAFPGYAAFLSRLSDVGGLPSAWRAALTAAKGIYLLTCPRTKEQYVGSASGEDGFLGRWTAYLDGGTGGNIGLASREPSDYQASILQVAGSADDRDAILGMEALWKTKLQSREMGLNRN